MSTSLSEVAQRLLGSSDPELDPASSRAGADERRAAVAIVLRANLEVLLMRRVERPDDRWSGQISLPGGHEDTSDTDLVETAMREAAEEVGVALGREHLLGRLPRVQAKARGRPLSMGILPFVFAWPEDSEPRPGVEAQETFWFPLARAAAGEFVASYSYRHEELRVELPCWHFEGRDIWGLTHEMLTRFIHVALAPDAPS